MVLYERLAFATDAGGLRTSVMGPTGVGHEQIVSHPPPSGPALHADKFCTGFPYIKSVNSWADTHVKASYPSRHYTCAIAVGVSN